MPPAMDSFATHPPVAASVGLQVGARRCRRQRPASEPNPVAWDLPYGTFHQIRLMSCHYFGRSFCLPRWDIWPLLLHTAGSVISRAHCIGEELNIFQRVTLGLRNCAWEIRFLLWLPRAAYSRCLHSLDVVLRLGMEPHLTFSSFACFSLAADKHVARCLHRTLFSATSRQTVLFPSVRR